MLGWTPYTSVSHACSQDYAHSILEMAERAVKESVQHHGDNQCRVSGGQLQIILPSSKYKRDKPPRSDVRLFHKLWN
ncbi:hypothetical protein KIN20_035967 [Parelaphostrongylus tenuis]|uniref:Uncharacterized protein n=1 Tax=Parelaphostrongylus tenuis TaxID=148309 RepID=A0AAD5RCH2_PARTN|nr:hypothetical protein KIN20_035967 [Parelaphostrongylus tenuis]